MDSTEQGKDHSTTEQPEEVKSDEAIKQSQATDDDNTQEETISKAEYKKLQAEYTKSRQELSEIKKQSEMSDEDKDAYNFIKENGFVTKADLEAEYAKIVAEAETKKTITNDKLAKAKSQWDVKWMPEEPNAKKSISEMSSEEYSQWKADNNIWKGFGSFS